MLIKCVHLVYNDRLLFNHYRISWLKINGRKFKQGRVIIQEMNLYLKFGLILEVLVFDVDNYFLVCDVLETECFSHHYHVYEVSRPSM